MKKFVLAVCIAIGLCASLSAQQSDQPLQPALLSAALPSAPAVSAQPSVPFASERPAALPALFASAAPPPSASASPQFPGVSAREDYYKWDLAVGYEFMHFNSAPFSANLSGLHTDLTYNFRDWLGVEGSVVSGWGSATVFGGERSKEVLFTGGVRAGIGTSKHRWSPWGHVLVGGLHMWPQVAREGRVGLAVQPGGGVDYRLNDRLSARAEADYVYSRLYSGSQNNFQFGVGIVIHF